MGPKGPFPSMGFPIASITRPSRASPTGILKGSPVLTTSLPGPKPLISPKGISNTWCCRNPTTSAKTGWPVPSAAVIQQASPTEAEGPEDSITNPTICSTRPFTLAMSVSLTRFFIRSNGGRISFKTGFTAPPLQPITFEPSQPPGNLSPGQPPLKAGYPRTPLRFQVSNRPFQSGHPAPAPTVPTPPTTATAPSGSLLPQYHPGSGEVSNAPGLGLFAAPLALKLPPIGRSYPLLLSHTSIAPHPPP